MTKEKRKSLDYLGHYIDSLTHINQPGIYQLKIAKKTVTTIDGKSRLIIVFDAISEDQFEYLVKKRGKKIKLKDILRRQIVSTMLYFRDMDHELNIGDSVQITIDRLIYITKKKRKIKTTMIVTKFKY